jgi:hypothetical protein
MKVKDINPYYILEVIYEEVDAIFKLKKKLNLITKLSDKEIDDIVNEAIEEVNDENHIPEPIEPSLSDKTQNDVLIFLDKLDQNIVLTENDIRLIVNKYLYTYIKL